MPESSTSPPGPGVRDHLRALFVAAHLFAITVMALPNPGRVSEKDLANPALQEVFSDWRSVAAGLGIELSPEDTNTLALTFANRFMGIRDVVLTPFRPYFKYTGTHQTWQMFGYLNRSPARFSIYVFEPGQGWQPIYLARDPDLAWRKRFFDSERMRGMMNRYSWKENHRGYNTFVDWLACEAAADFPTASSIRVAMEQVRLPEPETFRELGKIPTKQIYWVERRNLASCRAASEAKP